jgi:hypothetical protein
MLEGDYSILPTYSLAPANHSREPPQPSDELTYLNPSILRQVLIHFELSDYLPPYASCRCLKSAKDSLGRPQGKFPDELGISCIACCVGQ